MYQNILDFEEKSNEIMDRLKQVGKQSIRDVLQAPMAISSIAAAVQASSQAVADVKAGKKSFWNLGNGVLSDYQPPQAVSRDFAGWSKNDASQKDEVNDKPTIWNE